MNRHFFIQSKEKAPGVGRRPATMRRLDGVDFTSLKAGIVPDLHERLDETCWVLTHLQQSFFDPGSWILVDDLGKDTPLIDEDWHDLEPHLEDTWAK